MPIQSTELPYYLERWGLPLVAAGVLALAVWRVLIPLVVKQNQKILEMAEQQSKKITEMMFEQLTEARTARKEETDKFVRVVDGTMRQVADAQSKTTTTLDALVNEVREMKRGRS